MERDDIMMALARVQVMQEQLLISFNEHKTLQREMHDKNTERMDAMEKDLADVKRDITWAAGFVAAVAIPTGLAIAWVMDWLKQKLGF